MNPSRFAALWEHLKDDPAFRVGTVYAGASWFLLQAADTLGASPQLIRTFAVIIAAGFVLVVPTLWWFAHRQERSARATESEGTVGVADAAARRRSTRRRWAAAAAALFLTAGGLWAFRSRLEARPVPAAAERVAVLPFHATGSPEVRELSVGMVDLLTPALSDVGGIRTVASRTVLARLHSTSGHDELPLSKALEVGRSLGAGSVLIGSVTGFGSNVRLAAELRGVDGGHVLAAAEVQGSQSAMMGLTDQLAVGLLRKLWRSRAPVPTVDVAGLTTSSPAALRAYLRGERQLRELRFDSAAYYFRSALSSDSLFAMAWMRLAEATGWGVTAENLPTRRRYLRRALELSDRLPQRERSLIRAMNLRLRGSFAAFDSLESYTRRYPDDPMGWYELGDARYHAAYLGRFDDEEIVAPFLQSVRLDPAFGLGLHHVLDIRRNHGDRTGFEAALALFARVAPSELVQQFRLQAAVRWAPTDSLLHVFVAAIRSLKPAEDQYAISFLIGALGSRVRTDATVDPMVYPAAMDSMARIYASDRTLEAGALFRRFRSLASFGRVDSAFAAIDRLVELAPSELPPLAPAVQRALLRVSLAVRTQVPLEAVAADADTLAAHSDAAPFLGFLLNSYYLRAGDSIHARQYPDTVPTSIFDNDSELRPLDSDALRDAMHVWTTILAGDTAGGLPILEKDLDRVGWVDGARTGMPSREYGEILSRIPDRRAQGIRMLRWSVLWESIGTGQTYLALGRALEASGDRDGARNAYAQVLRLWDGADPYRHDGYEEARQALVRLSGEPR